MSELKFEDIFNDNKRQEIKTILDEIKKLKNEIELLKEELAYEKRNKISHEQNL